MVKAELKKATKSTNTDAASDSVIELDEFVPYLIRRISAHLGKSLAEALKPFGHSPNSWRVLLHLSAQGRCTLTELARYTLIDQSTLSRVIDKMEEEGLVRRQKHEGDGRITWVEHTKLGQSVFEEIYPIAMAQSEWALRGIEGDELKSFKTSLHRMLENIRISPYK